MHAVNSNLRDDGSSMNDKAQVHTGLFCRTINMSHDEQTKTTETSADDNVPFDKVLDLIGGFGLYQKWLFLLVSIPNLLAGLYMLNPAFYLGIPYHRCKVPGYPNDSYKIQNEFHRSLVNVTIPLLEDGTYDTCHVYVTHNLDDGQGLQNGSYSVSKSERHKVECKEWVYDKSVQEKTFVTENNLVCDKAVWVANSEMLFYGGMLLGSITSGIFSDMYGRKKVMYISCLVMAATSMGLPFCHAYWAFVLVNFLQGASIIASFMPAYVITVEMTSVDKRMWPAVATNIPYLLGLVMLSVVGYFARDWDRLALYTALPCVLLLPLWWLIPESPRWLLSKQKKAEAEVIIRKAAKWNGTSLPDKVLDSVIIDEEPSWKHFFKVFKSRKMTTITLVTCFNWLVCSISYFGLSLNMATMAGNYYLNFALSGLVEAPAYVIVMALVDRTGRRNMYCVVMFLGGIALASTFVTLYFGTPGKVTDGIILALALFGKCSSTAGFSIQYLYTAEVFPTIIRNAGLGVASMSSRVGTMVCPYIVILGKQMGGAIGKSFALVIIGCLCILSTLASLRLPETLNQPMPETIEDTEQLGRKKGKTLSVPDMENAELMKI